MGNGVWAPSPIRGVQLILVLFSVPHTHQPDSKFGNQQPEEGPESNNPGLEVSDERPCYSQNCSIVNFAEGPRNRFPKHSRGKSISFNKVSQCFSPDYCLKAAVFNLSPRCGERPGICPVWDVCPSKKNHADRRATRLFKWLLAQVGKATCKERKVVTWGRLNTFFGFGYVYHEARNLVGSGRHHCTTVLPQ